MARSSAPGSTSGGGQAEVADDLQVAADNDITAVPTFVFNMAYAVPGALDATALARVLKRLHAADGSVAT